MKKNRWIKRVIQIAFFTFIFTMVLTHYLEENGIELPVKIPNLHAICPFGAVETLGRLLLVDKFIPKTHESNFWVLLGSIGSTILFGALFCGWLCPLGSVQDLIGKIGNKFLKGKYNNVPVKLDRILEYLRYITLILIILQTTELLTLAFVKVDPYYALYHFWTGEALPSAIIILVIVLVSSIFVERPWCRWLCPFGTVQGIFQLISPWKIRRDSEKCINCSKCSKACPMKISVASINSVFDTRCNKCGDCLDSCSVEGALDHKLPYRNGIPINSRIATGFLVVLLFAAPIIIAYQTGLLKTSNKVAVKAGTLKAEDIKGSFTIQEVADGFLIPVSVLFEYLELPEEISNETKLKDIEDFDENSTVPVIREKLGSFRS